MPDRYAPVKVEYINPFVAAAANVFKTMLQCELERGQPYLKGHAQPDYEISGVIGLSGRATGTVVLSLGRDVALSAAEAMLGQRPEQLDADVVDTIGELTNMVAGAAKSSLEQLEMSLSLPSVIMGKNHTVEFPRGVTPIGIPFASEWGAICLDVGLCERVHEGAV
ncbi:MAG: chemotaxis protein CheX [Planctomycetales bacterium]|nr:chemotaxis protein CheX [Planctomycetales bacterium]